MVAGELLDLFGLLVDNVGGVLDVVVNEFFIRLVDKRAEEEDRGGDESEAPEWNDLDCKDALVEILSIEYGVLIGIDGRGSRCLAITESLALAW